MSADISVITARERMVIPLEYRAMLLPEKVISLYEVLENLYDYMTKIEEAESTMSNPHQINSRRLTHFYNQF